MPEHIDEHGFVTSTPDEPDTSAEPAEGTITKEDLVEDKPKTSGRTTAEPAEGTVTQEEVVEEKPKTSSRSKKAKTTE